jgi:hypothetical protein
LSLIYVLPYYGSIGAPNGKEKPLILHQTRTWEGFFSAHKQKLKRQIPFLSSQKSLNSIEIPILSLELFQFRREISFLSAGRARCL